MKLIQFILLQILQNLLLDLSFKNLKFYSITLKILYKLLLHTGKCSTS